MRPFAPELLKTRLQQWSLQYVGQTATRPQRSLMVLLLAHIFAGPDSNLMRHAFQNYFLGAYSSHDVPDEMVIAVLNHWLRPTKINNTTTPDPVAVQEALAGYEYVVALQGQDKLF